MNESETVLVALKRPKAPRPLVLEEEAELVAAPRPEARAGEVVAAEKPEPERLEGPRTIGRLRVYRGIMLALQPGLRLLFRLRRTGTHLIPKRGPLLLAINHVSAWDPLMLMAAMPRPVSFLAKSYVFHGRVKYWFFHDITGQIKVDRQRHGNEAAVLAAIRAIREGKAIGVYPEGSRTTDGHLKRFRTGLARIALATGAPVWPVVIKGGFEFKPKTRRGLPKLGTRVEVVAGPPLTFVGLEGKQDDPRVVRRVTDQIGLEMARLLGDEEHYRLVLERDEAPPLPLD